MGALLQTVGLPDRAGHLPDELSGGERQRVAVARAVAARPLLLLADEPTAQLDTISGLAVMALLRELVDGGMAALVATHDQVVTEFADRILGMTDGRLRA